MNNNIDYFRVSLTIDETIQDYFGKKYQNITFTLTMPDTLIKYFVYLNNTGDLFYNSFEDIMEPLKDVNDLWMFLYLDLLQYILNKRH